MAETPKASDRFKGLKPEIAEMLAVYENQYFRLDLPIPFCGLTIYPIQVRDYEPFLNCIDCFTLNYKENIEGLKRGALGYLIYKMSQDSEEGRLLSYKFQRLIELVFHIKNGIKCKDEQCEGFIAYDSKEFREYIHQIEEAQKNQTDIPQLKCPKCGKTELIEMIKCVEVPETKKYKLIIDGHEITHTDFEFLKEIVLFQNLTDYFNDDWVDPDLKKDYQARMEIQRKKNNVHATLEKKVVALTITTPYKLNEIWDLTIRKFTIMLSMVDELINYKIMRQASMSGLVQLPKDFKLEHWLYQEDKDPYGDAYKDMASLQKDVSQL